jgi:hypothetical protein
MQTKAQFSEASVSAQRRGFIDCLEGNGFSPLQTSRDPLYWATEARMQFLQYTDFVNIKTVLRFKILFTNRRLERNKKAGPETL